MLGSYAVCDESSLLFDGSGLVCDESNLGFDECSLGLDGYNLVFDGYSLVFGGSSLVADVRDADIACLHSGLCVGGGLGQLLDMVRNGHAQEPEISHLSYYCNDCLLCRKVLDQTEPVAFDFDVS